MLANVLHASSAQNTHTTVDKESTDAPPTWTQMEETAGTLPREDISIYNSDGKCGGHMETSPGGGLNCLLPANDDGEMVGSDMSEDEKALHEYSVNRHTLMR